MAKSNARSRAVRKGGPAASSTSGRDAGGAAVGLAEANVATSSRARPLSSGAGVWPRLSGAAYAVYKFLASVKLAVLSLSALAATLAYATIFEARYGTGAVQEWVYRSRGFAVLLAFLATNILCAALIRFPWKKRQTGFVITHVGLLTTLAGAFVSFKTADEGQLAILEGNRGGQVIRVDHPILRVQRVEPPADREYELPFQPGSFEWGPGKSRPRDLLANVLHGVTLGVFDRDRDAGERLTTGREPFQLTIKEFLPASLATTICEPGEGGVPMLQIRPKITPPGAFAAVDVFPDPSQRRLEINPKFQRFVRRAGPALFAFCYADRGDILDDFLNPPADAGADGVAIFHYVDKAGKPRRFDWKLEGQEGKTVSPPESDLAIRFVSIGDLEASKFGASLKLGDAELLIAQFEVTKAGGKPTTHYGWAMMPSVPNVIPVGGNAAPEPLVRINYFRPPALSMSTGTLGMVEILATPQGSLYERVFRRGKGPLGEVRDPAPVKIGEQVVAFGGDKTAPMKLSFEVERFLKSGVTRPTCVPINLPPNKREQGVPAVLAVMSTGGETREFWVRRSIDVLTPEYETVVFPDAQYKVAYDLDHRDLGFDLALDDFEIGFDPGSNVKAEYSSRIRLFDKADRIDGAEHVISMNKPLTHRGWTFYQSSYIPEEDPRTHRETGKFSSVFHVAKNPGWTITYGGVMLVVFGAFVQFYMRAGLFSDGGKTLAARAEAAKARLAAKAARAHGGASAAESANGARAKPSARTRPDPEAVDLDDVL